ncbi:MAG: FtsX-like permease family protein [Actinomycetota bacterium]
MFRIALKNVLARKGRLLLTALAVIASCAFLSGVFVFSDTVNASIDRMFSTAYANTDAFVRSANVIEGDFGVDTRARLADTMIEKVAAVPGVSEAVGDIQGFARIATAAGKPLGIDGPPKYGGVLTDSPGTPWKLAEGKVPKGPTEVVIDRRSAKEGKIKIGDSVTVTAKQGAQSFTVVGIATFANEDTSGSATWALFDLKTAEEFVVGEPGKIDSVIVRGNGSVSDIQLKANIAKALAGETVQVLTGAEITTETQNSVAKFFNLFSTVLTIFAAIALLVGSFVIYNVFRITSVQRKQESALMRAIGASRSQVVRSLFVEAGVVGIVGAVFGFLGGVVLASLILSLLKAVGNGPSDTTLTINASSFVITFIVGFIVTILCATLPAIRAGRVPPLAALRDVSIDRSGLSRRRVITGVVLTIVAVIGTVLGLNSSAVWLAPGVGALFAALIALGPIAVGPTTRALLRPLRALRGVTGEIAVRNAARSPERTALTAAALGIGLALLVAVATLGSSLQGSIRQTIGQQFTGNFAISTGDGQGFGGLPITLTEELNKLPEVSDAAGLGIAQIRVVENGTPKAKGVITVDPKHAAGLFNFVFTQGGWGALNSDTILVSKDKANRDGLTVGSELSVSFLDKSSKTIKVAGIFDNKTFGNFIVDRTLFDGRGVSLFDAQVFASTKAGVSEAKAAAAIKVVTDKYPTAKLQSRGEFVQAQVDQVSGILSFVYALLLMSVFIAVLGIVLTLLLAVFERRRELGLMRAIGMTRRQVRGSIRWEAIVTAVLGALMGTALGVALGWIVVRALRPQGFTVFSVSVASILSFAVVAIIFAVIAAWWPARRAAKSDILAAISTT